MAVDPLLFDSLHLLLRKHLPLVPPEVSPAHLNTVLDSGAGFHQWGRDLFQTMLKQASPELIRCMMIDGIDHDSHMIQLAKSQLRAGRGHVRLHQEDMLHLPAAFTRRYTLVHARFLAPYVTVSAWPALLNELVRVCQPGGWVVWIEPEMPTNTPQAPAWNQCLFWIKQAIDGMHGSHGITASMEGLLRRAETWSQVTTQVHTIPLSTFSRLQGRMTTKQMAPLHRPLLALHAFLQTTQVASEQQLTACMDELLEEILMRKVESQWTWHTVSGRKAR
jgi:ubiquinone/menaquinone biosynthesis C-methylase UbiE